MTDWNWESTRTPHTTRAASVGFTIIMALALLGFVVGIGDGGPARAGAVSDPPVTTLESHAIPSTHYADVIRNGLYSTDRPAQTLDALMVRTPVVPEMIITPTPESRQQSLLTRESTRAYNGAPPVIPHQVDQMSADACLACHDRSVRFGTRIARAMPHPFYTNCTQCHAPPAPDILTPVPLTTNHFRGVPAPWEGERAWVGAPPTIPHTTWMRDNCLACHGLEGWAGMETTHPWRQNCLQCHGPSATLDQSPNTRPTPFRSQIDVPTTTP